MGLQLAGAEDGGKGVQGVIEHTCESLGCVLTALTPPTIRSRCATAEALFSESTQVWTGPGALLRLGLGESLVGPLRQTARLFAFSYTFATWPKVQPEARAALCTHRGQCGA